MKWLLLKMDDACNKLWRCHLVVERRKSNGAGFVFDSFMQLASREMKPEVLPVLLRRSLKPGLPD